MSNIIEAEKVSFSYGGGYVFHDVDFALAPGSYTAVIGSNGAGKSTLLRLLLGELHPNTGTVRLFGQDSKAFKEWTRIGYVPQAGYQAGITFPCTAEEVLAPAGRGAGGGLFSKSPFIGRSHKNRIRECLALVGMEEHTYSMVSELSGGQQQRVMISRALMGEPKILILDEPTTGVDTQTIDTLFELLGRLNKDKGLTLLMVTHDIHRAAKHVTKVLCLEEGSLMELHKEALLEELSHRHVHPPHTKTNKKGDGNGHFSV